MRLGPRVTIANRSSEDGPEYLGTFRGVIAARRQQESEPEEEYGHLRIPRAEVFVVLTY